VVVRDEKLLYISPSPRGDVKEKTGPASFDRHFFAVL
jgi:hypothetical protein